MLFLLLIVQLIWAHRVGEILGALDEQIYIDLILNKEMFSTDDTNDGAGICYKKLHSKTVNKNLVLGMLALVKVGKSVMKGKKETTPSIHSLFMSTMPNDLVDDSTANLKMQNIKNDENHVYSYKPKLYYPQMDNFLIEFFKKPIGIIKDYELFNVLLWCIFPYTGSRPARFTAFFDYYTRDGSVPKGNGCEHEMYLVGINVMHKLCGAVQIGSSLPEELIRP